MVLWKKVMSLFKTNTTEGYCKPTLVSNAYRRRKELKKPKIHKEKIKKWLEDNTIKNISNLFILKKLNKATKGRTLFDSKKENYYEVRNY